MAQVSNLRYKSTGSHEKHQSDLAIPFFYYFACRLFCYSTWSKIVPTSCRLWDHLVYHNLSATISILSTITIDGHNRRVCLCYFRPSQGSPAAWIEEEEAASPGSQTDELVVNDELEKDDDNVQQQQSETTRNEKETTTTKTTTTARINQFESLLRLLCTGFDAAFVTRETADVRIDLVVECCMASNSSLRSISNNNSTVGNSNSSTRRKSCRGHSSFIQTARLSRASMMACSWNDAVGSNQL